MPQLNSYLKLMAEKDASDLFFSPGSPLHIKIQGTIKPVAERILSERAVKKLAEEAMDEEQRIAFQKNPEMNLGLGIDSLGRFRINIFRQRGTVAMVIRFLKPKIPTFDELNIPDIFQELTMMPRGLILIVGATGAGKSTTLASMVDYRNQNSCNHILTIEEPIEYFHEYKKSVVNQREIGFDTFSYEEALKNALREAPDVILIGEIRDRVAMQYALNYAETGHLCLATLHATNANHALQRIKNFFPESMHAGIFSDLSHNLAAIASQRLVLGKDNRRLPAIEVMLATPYIRDLILKGDIDQVREAMEKNPEIGMQTFDQSLFQLYQRKLISKETAMKYAESVSNLNVMLKYQSGDAPLRAVNASLE
jgi:twitching motility protein PilU